MMKNIDWQNYRHPKFLQSLNLTLDELKMLDLFLKQGKFGKVDEIENRDNSRLLIASNSSNSSKYYTKEKVGIDI